MINCAHCIRTLKESAGAICLLVEGSSQRAKRSINGLNIRAIKSSSGEVDFAGLRKRSAAPSATRHHWYSGNAISLHTLRDHLGTFLALSYYDHGHVVYANLLHATLLRSLGTKANGDTPARPPIKMLLARTEALA